MLKNIQSIKKATTKESVIYILDAFEKTPDSFSKEFEQYIKKQKEGFGFYVDEQVHRIVGVLLVGKETNEKIIEKIRCEASALYSSLKKKKSSLVEIIGEKTEYVLPFVEGLALTSYSFDKYLTKKDDFKLSIQVVGHLNEIEEIENVINGVHIARDFVNEPQNYLTATQYSKDMKALSKKSGFSIEVLTKKQIESLGMGGFLSVNKGSVEPPTFNILEWKPSNAKNKKPIVLIGKGVVYDTGGLSLKPTPNSMDSMKCDMAGSAAVVGSIYALAKNKIPIHVIGIIAATDNRPSLNAYAPGDVITMYNKTTVEVLNTDAEGRMTLADAISYSLKYKPELIIDIATLTGAAARAIGKEAAVMMGTADEKVKTNLKEIGNKTHERLVEFPLYDEYLEDLKSDIADIKNLGGAEAGAITAGKFLETFTDNKPWIHIDIAGTAWLSGNDKYRLKNGTGTGVRLFYNFIKNWK